MNIKYWVRIFRIVSAGLAALAATNILISLEIVHGAVFKPAKFYGLESSVPPVAVAAGLWFVLAILLALKRTPPGVSDCVPCLALILGLFSIKSSIDFALRLKTVQDKLSWALGDYASVHNAYLDQLGLQAAMGGSLVLMFLMFWIAGKIVVR